MSGDAGIAAALAALYASPKVQNALSTIHSAVSPVGNQATQFAQNVIGASPAYQNSGNGGLVGVGAGLFQQQDPLTQLYQNLINQLQTPVQAPTGINTQDLMNQVKAALNPIYDSQENVARNQEQRGSADIQGLYHQLADDYKKLAPQQVAQSKDAQKQVGDLYGQLRSNIEGSYARVSKEQGDEFQQLGIEAALPEVLGKQNAAVTDATTAASQNQAAQQQRYMDIGQMDSSFYREGSPNSIMRGNEESTNLLNELQDYIQQTEGQRASGIQSGYLQQLGSAQSSLAQQQQAANSENSQHQQMLWQILQSQMQNQQNAQNQKVTPDSFMSQLPQQTQQSVAQAFNSLQRSPEAVYGKVQDPRSPVPGTFVDTTPQWYEAQADKMFQSGQIDAATHQALLMYIQLSMGAH